MDTERSNMTTTKKEVFTIVEVNAETNEVVEREMTTNEIAELEILRSDVLIQQSALEAKAAARQSALAKLAELGLTTEEIQAL